MTEQEKAAEELQDEGDEEADTFDTEAVETPGIASSKKTTMASRAKTANSLSLISKKYDLDGDGKLDETERMMRDYDKDNDGNLDMREIHKIVQDLRNQQKELDHERKTILNMRRVIIGLVAFTFILTLAMLGVSFAAATLAKDTKADPATSSLTNKKDGKALSTVGSSRGIGYEMVTNQTEEEGRRSLLASTGSLVGQEFRRRMVEETDNEGDRSLYSFARAGDDDKNNDDDYDRYSYDDRYDDDRNQRSSYRSSSHSSYSRRSWNDCKFLEGTITKSDFYDILDAFDNDEHSYTFRFDDGNSRLRQRMEIRGGWHDSQRDTLAIDGGMKLDCDSERYSDSRYSSCQLFQPVYIFECDKQYKSNCNERRECCDTSCCDFSTCMRGLEQYRDSYRSN